MARTVTELPPQQYEAYPWDQWLNGDVWELAHGDDFKGSPAHFRNTARAAAQRRGLTVQTRIRDRHVYVEAAGHAASNVTRVCPNREVS